MNSRKTLRQVGIALMLLVAFLVQGTWALAGTTGTLQGQVTDQKTGAGVSGATVTAAAPSGNATTKTDATGHYNFLSLTPDTYTVSVDASGYQPASQAGITVFADNVQVVPFHISNLKEIGQVTSRSSNSYVKSGTTNDVYSVNPATQEALQGLGGGGNLNSAYSAVYGTPGVTSYTGNYGFGQVFYIRGGGYDQSGYEYDGVPVNRAFDNYNANSLSTLGQQELQVYTGSSPAGAASSTQVGFINQVIRTGTYPGFGNIGLGVGGPGFYHEAKGEAGGATPNRLFSYYVGVEGVNQAYNILNNQNGTNIAGNGSSQYGFTSNSVNPLVGALAPVNNNGPWSACNQGAGGAVAPAGSAPANFGNGPGGNFAACSQFLPYQSLYNDMNQDREFVANFHFGIPHKHDSGRDDVQLLMYNFGYRSSVASSFNKEFGGYGALNADLNGIQQLYCGPGCYSAPAGSFPGAGGPFANICATLNAFAGSGRDCRFTNGGPNPVPYVDGYIFPNGTSFGQNASTVAAVPYFFPGSPANRAFKSGISPDYADGIWNDGTVVKAQYQKNIGSNAYVRLLGYTFYSDWLQNAAETASNAYQLAIAPATFFADPVYELNTHTRGLEFTYANQINAQNLIQFAANYSTATVLRDNNTSGSPNWLASTGSSVTNFSDGTNCYSRTTGALASCYSGSTAGTYGSPTGSATTRINPATGAANCAVGPPAGLAGTAACAAGASMIVTVPNRTGSYLNRVTPVFTSVSLTDQWRPTDKLNIDLGLRFENYTYNLTNANYPEYNFWYNQAQQTFCYDPGTGLPMTTPVSPSTPPGSLNPVNGYGAAGCPTAPSGVPGVHPDAAHIPLTNVIPSSLSHGSISPRVSGTYTFNPDTVVRFSVGRFTQPTPTAFEEYLFGSGRIAPIQSFGKFFPLGYNTPAHDNPIQASTNYDFSYERHMKGTDMSIKLTPFYRYSQNTSVLVSLAPNFVSAINVGTQKTSGVEFAFQKGDPGREGLSAQLSVTLVNAKMKYNSIGGAPNAIDVLNNYIRAYNNLTSACATGGAGAAASGPSDNNPNHFCQAGNGVSSVAAPCYDSSAPFAPSPGGFANSPVACPAGYNAAIIANPYYNLPAQKLLDRNGYYETYPNYPPGDPNLGAGNTALSPLQFSGFVSYKHNKLTVTPNFTLAMGNKYGDPTAIVGLDPRNCFGNQGGAVVNGSALAPITVNPLLPDYQSCSFSPYVGAGNLAIPNPYSGKFDNMGQYRAPWQFNMGAQFKYEVSPKISATLLLANIVNRCFGGDTQPWQQAFTPNQYVCGYGDNTGGFIGTQPGAGFFYNGSGADAANGTAGYPKAYNYPYAPLSGASPFQAYFLLNFKI